MLGRRQLLRAGIAGSALSIPWPATARAATVDPGSSELIVSDATPMVETAAGSVRGYGRAGIHCFKGIPYAASTAGAARFGPPDPPPSWTGVRSALTYGPVCPQPVRQDRAFESLAFMFAWDDGYPAEDCLRVNVWTPGPGDGGRRPVMLWIHGGWFQAGSEWNPGIVDAGVTDWTLEGVARRLGPLLGDRAGAVLEVYRRGNPQARPFELYALIISARLAAVGQAEARPRSAPRRSLSTGSAGRRRCSTDGRWPFTAPSCPSSSTIPTTAP